MKLPDVNLLVYAADETSAHHQAACEWVEQALSGTETVAFAWLALIGFVRLSTSARAFRRPWGVGKALDVVEGWLAQPPHHDPSHRSTAAVLRDLLTRLGAGGNLTSDAHLVALAIEHGATLFER